jgi:hypothetical protein
MAMTQPFPIVALSPAPAENAGEHRAALRHRVLKAGKIVFDDWRAIDCQVRDISDTGAKIRIESTASLPHKFRLLIVADNTIRPVQIAWKLHNTIGVAFTGDVARAPIRKL